MVVSFVVIVVIALIAVAFLRYYPKSTPQAADVAPAADNRQERDQRHRQVDEHGAELIDRRVDLDLRRGALGGDQELDRALRLVEDRFRHGDIDELEFEREKVRLLSGL